MIDSSVFHGKRAAYFTLGCKLNYSETSTYGRMLEELGVVTAGRGESADICIVNTCTVTDVADHKCRQAIHRMVREHPGALVVVTGCYAQLQPGAVGKIDGVGLVIGNDEKGMLVDYLTEALARGSYSGSAPVVGEAGKPVTFVHSCSRGSRTRYFLKVQDGCSYFCTYCTIPFARGQSRNPTIASLLEQVRRVVAEGGKEIVLTGVNIGDFGRSTGETFLDLVRALDGVDGVERFRISSIEPDLLSDELIEYCAASRAFMPHFHIPLQSGCDEVLRLMRRRYDTRLFAGKVGLIRRLMPDAFIGVDVMVGTRGETPELFERSYAFVSQLDVTQLHVFPYSERPGTAALKIAHSVTATEKKARCRRLLSLSESKTHAFYSRHIGTEAEVLCEKSSRGRAVHGFTKNYIRVELPGADDLSTDNSIRRVRLCGFSRDGRSLRAEMI